MKMEIQGVRAIAAWVDDSTQPYLRLETPGEDDNEVRVWWFAPGIDDDGIGLRLTAMMPGLAEPMEDEFKRMQDDE